MTKPWFRGAAISLVTAAAICLAGRALAGRDQKTSITIGQSPVGGQGYGGSPPGAFVTHRREVEIGPDGVLRFPGVAASMDPATVELRSVTDPRVAVVEQRFVNDLVSAEGLLHRQIGNPVTVLLSQGQVTGTLRAVSAESLVIETAGRGFEIVPRGAHVVDIKLSGATFDQEPTLEWKVLAKQTGKHLIDVSYRTTGLTWQPEYTAVVGDGDRIDVTAWATVRNDSGLDLSGAKLMLTRGDWSGLANRPPVSGEPPALSPFKINRPIDLPSGRAMMVELAPRQGGGLTRRRIVFEGIADDPSPHYQATPASDCYAYTEGPGPRVEQVLEVAGPGVILPEGRLRVFRRKGGELVVLGDDTLRVNRVSGALRIRTGVAPDITGERKQVECRQDPGGRSLTERIEVKLTNQTKSTVDVIVREYLFRWIQWKIQLEDAKGARAGGAGYEFPLRIPAGASKSVTYTVVYSW